MKHIKHENKNLLLTDSDDNQYNERKIFLQTPKRPKFRKSSNNLLNVLAITGEFSLNKPLIIFYTIFMYIIRWICFLFRENDILYFLNDEQLCVYTYSLVHLNLLHIIANNLLFLIIGFLLETTLKGWIRTFIVAFIDTFGIISARIVVGYFQEDIKLVGSSAGVYTLTVTYIVALLINSKEVDPNKRFFSWTLAKRAFISLIIFLILLADNLWSYFYTENNVSFLSHVIGSIIGLIFGFLVGVYYLGKLRIENNSYLSFYNDSP